MKAMSQPLFATHSVGALLAYFTTTDCLHEDTKHIIAIIIHIIVIGHHLFLHINHIPFHQQHGTLPHCNPVI